ncbi:hypothetical protein BJ742DRAFT_814554, partial [Cladochytrium replicatum]
MATNRPTARVSLLGAIPNDAGVSLLDVANFLDFAETGTGDIALKGTIQRTNNTSDSYHPQPNSQNAGYNVQARPGDEMFRRNGPDGQLMLNPDTLFVSGVGELTLGTGTLERRIKTQDRSIANASPSRSEKSTSSTSSSVNQQVYNKGQVWQRPSPSAISQPVETLPVFSRKQSIEASSKELYLLHRNAKAEQPPPLPTTPHGTHRQSSQSHGFMSPQTAPYGIGTSQYGQSAPMSFGGKERIRSVPNYNESPVGNVSLSAMPYQGTYQPSVRDSTPSASPRTSTASAGMSPYLFSPTPSQGSPSIRHSTNYQQSPAYFSPGTEVQWSTGTHALSPRVSQSNGAVSTPPQTPSFRAMSADPLSQPSTPTTPKYAEAQVTSAFQHQQLQQHLQQQSYDPYSGNLNQPSPQMKPQIPPSRRSESAAHSPYTANAPMPFPTQTNANAGLMNKIFTKTAGVVGGVVYSGRRKSNAASSLAHFNANSNSSFSGSSSKNAERHDKFEELLKKKDAETVKLSLTPSFLGVPGGNAAGSAAGSAAGNGDEPEQSQQQQQQQHGGWKQQPLQQEDHSTSSSFGAKLTRSLSSKSLKSYSRKGRS